MTTNAASAPAALSARRNLQEGLLLMVAGMEPVKALCPDLSPTASALMKRFWPGALTLVVPRLDATPDWLGHPARRSIGLRCPNHPVALEPDCGAHAPVAGGDGGNA